MEDLVFRLLNVSTLVQIAQTKLLHSSRRPREISQTHQLHTLRQFTHPPLAVFQHPRFLLRLHQVSIYREHCPPYHKRAMIALALTPLLTFTTITLVLGTPQTLDLPILEIDRIPVGTHPRMAPQAATFLVLTSTEAQKGPWDIPLSIPLYIEHNLIKFRRPHLFLGICIILTEPPPSQQVALHGHPPPLAPVF